MSKTENKNETLFEGYLDSLRWLARNFDSDGNIEVFKYDEVKSSFIRFHRLATPIILEIKKCPPNEFFITCCLEIDASKSQKYILKFLREIYYGSSASEHLISINNSKTQLITHLLLTTISVATHSSSNEDGGDYDWKTSDEKLHMLIKKQLEIEAETNAKFGLSDDTSCICDMLETYGPFIWRCISKEIVLDMREQHAKKLAELKNLHSGQ